MGYLNVGLMLLALVNFILISQIYNLQERVKELEINNIKNITLLTEKANTHEAQIRTLKVKHDVLVEIYLEDKSKREGE